MKFQLESGQFTTGVSLSPAFLTERSVTSRHLDCYELSRTKFLENRIPQSSQ